MPTSAQGYSMSADGRGKAPAPQVPLWITVGQPKGSVVSNVPAHKEKPLIVWLILNVDVEGRPLLQCVYAVTGVSHRAINAVKKRHGESNGGDNGKLLLPVNDQGKNSCRKG